MPCCFSLYAAEPIVQVDGKPNCCFFKFSPKLMFTKVLKAQLWVYLRPLQQTSTVYLQILRLKPVTDQGSRHIRIRSLKIELNSRSGYWQSIDFKHVLQNWFKQPHTNWGIDINAFDESGNDLAVTSLRPGEEGLVRTLRPADQWYHWWCYSRKFWIWYLNLVFVKVIELGRSLIKKEKHRVKQEPWQVCPLLVLRRASSFLQK